MHIANATMGGKASSIKNVELYFRFIWVTEAPENKYKSGIDVQTTAMAKSERYADKPNLSRKSILREETKKPTAKPEARIKLDATYQLKRACLAV